MASEKAKVEKGQQPPPEPKFDRNGFIRCRVCGCTEVEACVPPCSWVEGDLCSACAEAAISVANWMDRARRPNKTALWREALRWMDAEAARELRKLPTDTTRINALEAFVKKHGALVLHDGNHYTGTGGYYGLSTVDRTLRRAIDSSLFRRAERRRRRGRKS